MKSPCTHDWSVSRSSPVKGSPRLARVLAALRAAPARRGRCAPLTGLSLEDLEAGSRRPKTLFINGEYLEPMEGGPLLSVLKLVDFVTI